ncbi:MAG: ROK family transcriptional regulator [Treponema sp.]|nr:ROK family transcriptional regulator [Treponema sp.]
MKAFSGKPQMLKKVNSSMIEQLIFEKGPLSKPELAKRTGLSLPTIGKLVDDLEKNARLCPAGRRGKGAGRKAVLYETNRNSGCLLACYYKEGSFLCRLADMRGGALYEETFPLDPQSGKKALNSAFHAIDALMQRAPAQVKIIGIGLPGVVQPGGRLLAIPQIAVWEGFNLEKALRTRYKTAVYVENGVNLSAMGYFCTHSREKQDNLVYLYVGNGIGSGIILNRQLFRGTGNFSGEIGFMAEPSRPPGRNFVLGGGYMESLMGPLVDYSTGDLRQRDNPGQRKELAAILSTIAVNHVVLVNPGVIVLAGKIFDKNLVEAITQRMAHYLPAESLPRITRDLSGTTGLEGLIQSCRGYITTGIHLVQSSGLPQQLGRMPV